MIWFDENGKSGTQADLKADATSDVQDLPTFAETHKLKPGSSCYVIGSSDLYMMKSDRTWKKQ